MKPLAIVGTALFLLGGQETSLRELMERLQDDAIDAREEAAAELVRRGAAALAPLREAIKSASGERRLRLEEAVRRIEEKQRVAAVLRPATLVSVEATDRPLRQVLEELSKASGTLIEWANVPEDVRVTWRASKLPFWEALDEACRASGKFTYEVAQDRVRPVAGKHADFPRRAHGPFAISLRQIEMRVRGDFGGGAPSEQTSPRFVVCWEKGTQPDRVFLTPVEVRDDRGTDLLSRRRNVVAHHPEIARGHIAAPSLHLWINQVPDAEATRLARLRFEVTVEFHLEFAGVSFRTGPAWAPSTQPCEKFSATLEKFSRDGNAAHLRLKITPVDGRREGIQALKVRFTDKDGKVQQEPLGRHGSSRSGKAFTIASDLHLANLGEVIEISVVAPSRVHTEKIDCDFKDIPIK